MYNGIGLTTPRGSGTNGFVTRNLSSIRKTKEKIEDYRDKEDSAVRPFDIGLIEHDRRRQAEVRCVELQEMLEEEGLPEEEITKKVNAFRAKLLADKKSSIMRDSSGRPIVKDSHELSMAQEQKNENAKNAFGIREDFVPGSSVSNMNKNGSEKAEKEGEIQNHKAGVTAEKEKAEKDKKKKKKSRRRDSTSSSSSSSSSSSDEEVKRKRRKREKKKKSKKSRSHHRHSHHSDKNKKDDRSRSRERQSTSGDEVCACCNSTSAPVGCLTEYSIHSDSLDEDDLTASHDLPTSTATMVTMNLKQIVESPLCVLCETHTTDILAAESSITSPVLVLAEVVTQNDVSPRSRSSSPPYRSSRDRSQSPRSRSTSRSVSSFSSSRTRCSSGSSRKSRSDSADSFGSQGPSRFASRSTSRSSSRSKSVSRSRSLSRSMSSPQSVASKRSSRSLSIPRRRGSPSFLDRRRITSARKRPIPYKRAKGDEYDVSSETPSPSDSDSDSSSR